MTHTIFVLYNNNGKLGIKWNYKFLSKESQEAIEIINTVYDKRTLIWLTDNRKELKPKKDRTCRFCGKSNPEVTFKNKAHKVPELIGNKYHLSDFECDNCNDKFRIFENDFANYLALFRTIAEITGKKGTPKYKSRDKDLTVEQEFTNHLLINLNNINNKVNIIYDANGEGFRIQSEGDPYVPINVFRCLLKCTLSFVEDEDLKHLSNTIKFLFDFNFIEDKSKDFIFGMHQYFIPGNFNTPPFIVRYKKADKFVGFPAPSMIFVFYIRNLILQLFIPFHENDTFIYEADAKRHLYLVPPLINDDWFKKYGGPFPRFVNLNNSTLNKKNIQVIDWKYTRQQPKN